MGRLVIEGGIHTVYYLNGDLSKGMYQEALGADAVKAGASGILTAGVLVCFTNPGTAVVFLVAAGACITVDLAYNAIEGAVHSTDYAMGEFFRRLPNEVKTGLLVERIHSEPSLYGLNRGRRPLSSSAARSVQGNQAGATAGKTSVLGPAPRLPRADGGDGLYALAACFSALAGAAAIRAKKR